MKVYFFVGIKRSGNHAILNWLYKMIPNYIHLNNLRINSLNVKHYKKHLTNKDEFKSNEIYSDNSWIPFTKNHNLIISLENQDLNIVKTRINKFVNQSKVDHEIILLIRSPHNNMASVWKIFSRQKYKDTLDSTMDKHIKLWFDYAEEAIHNKLFGSCKVVLYDRWFMDQQYRSNIANNFDLQFDDSNFEVIYRHGSSSFDGYKYQNNASKMDVLNRFDALSRDTDFLTKIGQHKEIMNIKWNVVKHINK